MLRHRLRLKNYRAAYPNNILAVQSASAHAARLTEADVVVKGVARASDARGCCLSRQLVWD